MTNINKINIVVINLSDEGYMPSLELFDHFLFFNDDMFVGVFIDNPNTRFELENSGSHMIYDVLSFSYIPTAVRDVILNYIGFNLTTDEILDIMLDEKLDYDRRFYLETVLYYKNNQLGKNIKEYSLRVKHFDDLIHYFPEDFVSYEILQNNEDFSESDIRLRTYLTNEELKEKFKNYIL